MTEQTDDTDRPSANDGLSVASVFIAGFALVAAILAVGFGVRALSETKENVEAGSGSAAPVSVSLSEFAIAPEMVMVSAGGSLEVSNEGSAVHNLTVADQDVTTGDLQPGASAELSLGELASGEYQLVCTIAGHADAGMKGTLHYEHDAAEAATDHSAHGSDMSAADYAALDKAMADSIGEFPAETEGLGNQPLEPTEVLADGTKVFDLAVAITPWEVAPGNIVDAWTYNGQAPGPSIHLEVGDHVQMRFTNNLPMNTDVHFHGVDVPNEMDGVAPLTQPYIQPGETFTYEFTTREIAVAMYHAHHHAQMMVPNGMFGTIFVGHMPLPAGRTISGIAIPKDLTIAQEIPMVLNDAGVIGLSLNGKSFPATQPYTGKVGDWVLVQYFNEGTQIHPMHQHQFDQFVIAKDGYPLDSPYATDTVNVAPGERFTVLVHLTDPGAWVWHCHILPHVESDAGMFGMVTAFLVES